MIHYYINARGPHYRINVYLANSIFSAHGYGKICIGVQKDQVTQ